MNIISIITAAAITAVAALTTATAMNDNNNATTQNELSDVRVLMHTTEGDVTLLLYGDTPAHTRNFVRLASEGFYDGLLFHRVINEFMVQGGDPDSRNAEAAKMLGGGDLDYKIDAEFVYPRHFHKRGALAAAREGDMVNPAKQSSASQFYIVTGKTFTPEQIDQLNARRLMEQKKAIFNSLAAEQRDTIMAMRRSRDQAGLQALQDELVKITEQRAAEAPDTLTAEQRQAYTTVGGAPHLDGSYTVYGEVIDGMDTIDRIQKVETDANDRPVADVRIISMEILQ